MLLHEVAEGPADRSFGIAVARLAGCPPPRSGAPRRCSTSWRPGRQKTGGLAAGLDDLPLFAAAIEAEEEAIDTLRAELDGIDVDALSPRDALEALYRLKAIAREA